VALDSNGNIYIADEGNNKIRKIDSSGNISTIAGTGSVGSSGDGGLATLAKLKSPSGVALDSNGNIYIADEGNNKIRKIDAASGPISNTAIDSEVGTLDTIHYIPPYLC
jgi:DNA-binding beta-propeller fold protein YncE